MLRQTKHGLGRGLDALLGDPVEPQETAAPAPAQKQESGDAVREIAISLIDTNPDQPRKRFEESSLEELAASIASVGVIQPLIVKENGGRYQIIAGERRWRASLKAGLTAVPCIVRTWDETKRLEVALVENLQRDDLNPVEEALGIQNLMEQCGYTQETVSARIGRSRPAVANLLRLLHLPEKVLDMLRDGRLSAGHARALVTLPDADSQLRIANLAVAQGWSVRQMEDICKKRADAPAEKPAKAEKTGEMKKLERMGRSVFGTKAELIGNEDKGKFVLHYYNKDDLQRIWDILECMGQNI